jgi:hypothetical protein
MCSFLSFSDESDESSRIAAAGTVEIGATFSGVADLQRGGQEACGIVMERTHGYDCSLWAPF